MLSLIIGPSLTLRSLFSGMVEFTSFSLKAIIYLRIRLTQHVPSWPLTFNLKHMYLFSSIRLGLFSRLPGPRVAQRPGCQLNQCQHQLIKIKLCVSHCTYKSIPDTKFDTGSSSNFGDMTSQNFPQKKGTSHQIRLFTP